MVANSNGTRVASVQVLPGAVAQWEVIDTQPIHNGSNGTKGVNGTNGTNAIHERNGVERSHEPDEETEPSPALKGDLALPDPHTLMKPKLDLDKTAAYFEELTILSALDMEDELPHVDSIQHPTAHLNKYHDWLVNTFLASAKSGVNDVLPNASNLADLPLDERTRRRMTLFFQLEYSFLGPCALAIEAVRSHWRELMDGTVDPLALVTEDGTLQKVYDMFSSWDYAPLLDQLGHKNSALRVLEIGAGTGGMTANILPALFGEESEVKSKKYTGERLCSTYTYTDISASSFPEARSRFAAYDSCIEYAVLDITKDPLPQLSPAGEECHYDLIIAANVLHATPCLQATLANVRKLLRPDGGRLLLQELCPASSFAKFIEGIAPVWWMGGADGRALGPFVSRERWRAELETAGFEMDGFVLDAPAPLQVNASILASTVALEPKVNGNGARHPAAIHDIHLSHPEPRSAAVGA